MYQIFFLSDMNDSKNDFEGLITDETLLKESLRPSWLSKTTKACEFVPQFQTQISVTPKQTLPEQQKEQKQQTATCPFLHQHQRVRKQQIALSSLVWMICQRVRTVAHSEFLAERTVALLLQQQDAKSKLQYNTELLLATSNISERARWLKHHQQTQQQPQKENFSVLEFSDEEVATLACDDNVKPFAHHKKFERGEQEEEEDAEANDGREKIILSDDDAEDDDDDDEDDLEKLVQEQEKKKKELTNSGKKKNRALSLNRTVEDDLEEIEEAIREKYPRVHTRNLPQPPLVFAFQEGNDL